jgi:hypothetical protein
MKLTKKQALKMFSELWKEVKKPKDAVMKSQDWNNFTDMLCKDKQITLKQYESWTNPF